jgi:hypothetical protein
MTYLVISKDKQLQESYLIKLLSDTLGKDISEIEEFPDLHILYKPEENSIGIEDVKSFTSKMIFMPFNGDKQVAIIYEAEKLTPQAQNSLLKTLEESRDNTIYILCVDNKKNVLSTIYSRSKPIFVKQNATPHEVVTRPEILDMDLVKQFECIETVADSKEDSIKVLNDIEEFFKFELEKEIKNDNINSSRAILNHLKYIQETRGKINSNCNKRLVLEALFVYLNAYFLP